MKKILTIVASLAIVAGFASCKKENVSENTGSSEQATITATFADQTKVVYAQSGNDLQPTWEVGDTIVGICNNEPFELKVKSISGDIATLEANVDSNIPEGDVTLFYKSGLKKTDWDSDNKQFVVSFNNQKGDKTMPAIMKATGTINQGAGDFTFENSGAVLGIYEVGSGLNSKTIKQVTLYGKNLASSATLDKTNGVKFTPPTGTYNVISTEILSDITVGEGGTVMKNAESKPILMAVPAEAIVDSVFIRTTDGEVYSLGSSNKTPAMAAGDYRYIKDATFVRDAKRDDMILTGVYSVQNGEDPVKQVFFSKGNLTYDVEATTNKWKFYEHQYDCATDYDSNLISLFTWGYDATKSIVPNGSDYVITHTTDGETLDKAEDWGCTIGDGNTWRTLSIDEWYHLFENRNVMRAQSGVDIEGATYSGVFIYPDNYNGDEVSSSMTWNQINAAGIVYLPFAGYRNGSNLLEVNEYGRYWSSTASGIKDAYHVMIEDGWTVDNTQHSRKYGCSVRLITECQ